MKTAVFENSAFAVSIVLHINSRRNRSYGKRSIHAEEEMDTVTRQIVKLFHRASELDAEQCVSRLICEVNADPGKPKSVRINNYSLPG